MFKVYWTNPDNNEAHSEDFKDLSLSLKSCEELRRIGRTFVTMVSENPNNVGKVGVDGVTNGILPTGEKYSWNKNDRVGSAFKSPPPVSTDNIEVELDDTH